MATRELSSKNISDTVPEIYFSTEINKRQHIICDRFLVSEPMVNPVYNRYHCFKSHTIIAAFKNFPHVLPQNAVFTQNFALAAKVIIFSINLRFLSKIVIYFGPG